MCGIAGIWSLEQSQDQILADLNAAVAALRHRGPDDHGVWTNGTGLAFGHTRLSILDLSDAGHQPMVSKDGRFTLIFNGEVYNFREVRECLSKAGHSFTGIGDSEVILHAFNEWGPNAVEKFIGMFAIALWDEAEQTLILFRDRIGVKPLYYGWDGKNLVFASELKAIRCFGHWTPEVDKQSLGEFLQYGYISGNRTIYQGIHKLEPGYRLTLARDQKPIVHEYWSVLDALGHPLDASDAEIEAELEALLIDSFRYRMVSDVPVGVYLSGGVDSSLVTALLAKHYDQKIRTFTIGFGEASHDESVWAKKVADHCGTQHTEYKLDVGEALEIAKDWGGLFDEPFGDSSGIPTLLVSRLASQEVKVVLSADGGDELFNGYNSYTGILGRLEKLSRIPAWAGKGVAGGLSLISGRQLDTLLSHLRIPAAQRGHMTRKLHRLKSMLSGASPGSMMDLDLSHWYESDIHRLIGGYATPRTSANAYPGGAADKISLWDFHNYLPEDILTKVDRTTMAVSIEGREPLLDHRLAEFAFRLPIHMRRGSLGPKHALKSILYRYVPRHLVDRPKQGFGIPLEKWLHTDLSELVHDYLSEHRIREAGIMDGKQIKHLVNDFYAGNSYLTTPLWFVLAFEMWREHWG